MKVMPQTGYSGVSIPIEIFEVARKYMEKHKKELALKRIRSLSDLFQEAVLEYCKEEEHGV